MVLTNNHGVGQKETSYGSILSHRLDRIEDNPKPVIETWMSIRNELMPRMTDVDAVTAVELFEAHLTGQATREFAEILRDSAEWLIMVINHSFNQRLCEWGTAEKNDSTRAVITIHGYEKDRRQRALVTKEWIEKQTKREEGRQGKGVQPYTWKFPPPKIAAPPRQPNKDQFFNWGPSGLEQMDQCSWLRMEHHGWEFMPHFLDKVLEGTKKLAFKAYGPDCGRQQLDYLSEDLVFEHSHKLKNFFRLLQAHSEAIPYYLVPKKTGDTPAA